MTPFSQGSNDISPIINGMFFGYVVATLLLGMTVNQGWMYYRSNHDKWPLRALVASLILLDIADTCFSTEILHHYLISHFGDYEVLQQRSITIYIEFAITALTFFLVHGYYARSLYLVSQSPWVPSIIAILSTATIVIMIYPLITVPKSQTLGPRYQIDIIFLAIFHSIEAMVDILITLSLTIAFRKMEKSFQTSHSLLHRLIVYTASRGILVTVAQIAHITMFIVNPTNLFFWMAIHLTLSKLYVISTLVTLNHRESVQNREVSIIDILEFNTRSGATDAEDAVEANVDMRESFHET